MENRENFEEVEQIEPPATEDEEFDEFEEEYEELTLVEKVVGVFASPVSTFRYLADHPDFWSAFLITGLVAIALGLLAMPKMMPVQEGIAITQTMSQLQEAGMSEAEQTSTLEVTRKVLPWVFYGQAILGPLIMLPILWFLTAIIAFFTALIQGLAADFKKLMGTVPWLMLIFGLSNVIYTVKIMMTANFGEEQLMDMRFLRPISALALVPESVDLHPFVTGLLSQIDPIFIWYVIVMVIALEAVNKCKRGQAILTTAVVNVLMLLGFAAIAMKQIEAAGL